MLIREIAKDTAVDFIRLYHYSKIMPRLTKRYLGFFEENRLVGVITLGWGTQPLHTIRKIFYKDELLTKDYIEIGKMCFLPEKNNTKGFGSQTLSELIKWCKVHTDYLFLYTLADGIMGKCGYVYQATNFIYLDSFKTSVYMDNKTGEKIHPRTSKNLCIENAQYENKKKVFWLTHKFCEYKGISKINGLMFRYIIPLNRTGKKILSKYPEYVGNKYPKDINLIFEKRVIEGKFEKISPPKFNMNIFEHSFQKPKDKEKVVSLWD